MELDIEDMTGEQAKKKLQEIVNWLDDLDTEDFFGTEGWKHMIGWEN